MDILALAHPKEGQPIGMEVTLHLLKVHNQHLRMEPAQINNKEEKTRIDATCTNDPVQLLSEPAFGEPDIPSSDDKIRIKSKESIMYIHRDLIDGNSNNLWKLIKEFLTK